MRTADHTFIARLGEISGDGVAVYDLNTRKFVYANRFFKRIFDVPEGDELDDGAILTKHLSEEDLQYLKDRYVELLSIGCISASEFAVTVKGKAKQISGEVLWLEESYAVALFVRDISLARQHDEYVLKYTAQKDMLLDMLIHNLSAPLYMANNVMGLAAGSGCGEEVEKYIALARRINEECLSIVNSFLKREMADSASVVVEKVRFDCVSKIRDIVSMLGELSRDHSVSLRTDLPSLPVHSDPIKFLQVIQNILSNAIKFTPERGSIVVHIGEDEKHAVVDVVDSGVGIAEEIQPQLLKERVQGRTGLKGEPTNGVGLFHAAQLIGLLGGSISFKSEQGNGSHFSIRLPKE